MVVIDTAKILNDVLKVRLEPVNELRERNNYGILTGMVKSEAKQKHPLEVDKLAGGNFRHGVTDSEDYEEFRERVIDAFGRILKNKEYETIAIISYGNVIRCILREILKLGELKHLGDCAIFEIEKEKNKLRLVRMDNASLESKS